jgi:hypothetical protein
MMTLNEIRYNPATSTFLSVFDIALRSSHTQNMLLCITSTERYTLHENNTHIEARLRDFSKIIYCFTSRSKIFHLYGDVIIICEGLQNLGLCSALRAFEQGGIFILPHLL